MENSRVLEDLFPNNLDKLMKASGKVMKIKDKEELFSNLEKNLLDISVKAIICFLIIKLVLMDKHILLNEISKCFEIFS